ncbi:MAG: GvpL/GvpF family gas vesicle protein [Chloroflexales bacterium]|nr:GvpL/GvpF family gas vesicle protein [Chloroflexales bacterium]
MIEQGKYLYCIMRSLTPRQFISPGIGGPTDIVHTVQFKDLAAVISNAPVEEYDANRRNMMAHTKVLEEAMLESTVLPMRFGTVAQNAEVIQEQILQQRYHELDDLLHQLDGQIELGLKAFWREDIVFREIVAENQPIRQLNEKLAGRSPEQTYYERIQLGKLVEEALNAKRNTDTALILERLRPLAREVKINPVFTEKMALNAAFLIAREQEASFDQAVQGLDAELGSRMLFKYVGAMPPYDFVDLTIR